tara:strand:- start:3747 stop:4712 length:966 start_codon:yes stop_codon:yes gene_type:complete
VKKIDCWKNDFGQSSTYCTYSAPFDHPFSTAAVDHPLLLGHDSYVPITPIHADKKQKKVKPRRTGANCFESKSPEKFGMIMHDLRHGALMHELTAHYQVPQSTIVILRRHYNDLIPEFDRGASTRVEVTRKEEVAKALEMLKGGAIYAEVTTETGLDERTIRRLRNTYLPDLPPAMAPVWEEDNPQQFKQLCRALTSGFTNKACAQHFGLNEKTVASVKQRHGEAFPEWRTKALGMARMISIQLLESMEVDLLNDRLPASSKALAAGILIDKSQLLAGSATQITETRSGPKPRDINAALRGLEVVDAEVVEPKQLSSKQTP